MGCILMYVHSMHASEVSIGCGNTSFGSVSVSVSTVIVATCCRRCRSSLGEAGRCSRRKVHSSHRITNNLTNRLQECVAELRGAKTIIKANFRIPQSWGKVSVMVLHFDRVGSSTRKLHISVSFLCPKGNYFAFPFDPL